MQEILLETTYFERHYQKAFKKLTLFYFFFQTQSLLMDKIMKSKMGLQLVIGYSSCSITSQRFKETLPSKILPGKCAKPDTSFHMTKKFL